VTFHPWRVCRDPLLNRIFRHRFVERTDTWEWLLDEPDFRQKERSTARGVLIVIAEQVGAATWPVEHESHSLANRIEKQEA
jgi:hypothetical protein